MSISYEYLLILNNTYFSLLIQAAHNVYHMNTSHKANIKVEHGGKN